MLREKNRIFMLLAVIVLVFAVVLSVSVRQRAGIFYLTDALPNVILITVGYRKMQGRGIVQFIPNPESCRVMRGSGGRIGTHLGAAAPNFR